MKSSTNSKVGSYHWFHTLLAHHKHIGEYLANCKNMPDDAIIKSWGENLQSGCKELIEGYNQINKPSMKEKVLKYVPVVVLGVVSVTELIVTKSLGLSVLLWVGYGCYLLLRD